MSKDSLQVFCNKTTLGYDIPTPWPKCSTIASCPRPNTVYGIMETTMEIIGPIMEKDKIE